MVPPRSRTKVTVPVIAPLPGAAEMHVLRADRERRLGHAGRHARGRRTAGRGRSRGRRCRRRPSSRLVDADEVGDEGVGRLAVDLDRRRRLPDLALPMTTTRSAMVMASRWSWVTTMVVMPSRCCSWRSSTCMASRSLASSADSGSSSRNSFGDSASARAIATRWRWPPESLATGRSAKPGRWISASSSSTRFFCSSLRRAADAQRIGDVVADRQVREQRQRLEHHAEIALVRRHRRDVVAVEHDRAAGRLLEPGDHAQQAWSCRSRTGRAGRRTCRAAPSG